MEGFGGHGDRDDTTPLPPEAMAEEIWNPQSAEEIQWLCDQLREWPVRVHTDRTCNITYLMKAAAARIAATSAAEGEVEALRAISQQLESDIKEYASDLQSIEARATKAEAENTRLREAGNKLAAQSRSYSRGMSGSPDLGTALNAWDAVSRQARDQGDVG